MILGVQIIGLMFVIFMIYLTFLSKKKNEFTFKEGFFWLGIWLVFAGVTLFPRSITFIAKDIFNLTRPLDLYIIVGFMFMIGTVFYIYTILRRLQRKVDSIVRKNAIEKAYEPKEKNKAKDRKK